MLLYWLAGFGHGAAEMESSSTPGWLYFVFSHVMLSPPLSVLYDVSSFFLEFLSFSAFIFVCVFLPLALLLFPFPFPLSPLPWDLLQPPCSAFSPHPPPPPPPCIQTSFSHPVLPSLPLLSAFRPPSTTLSCLLSPSSLHSDLLQSPCPAFSPPPLCIQTSFNHPVLPSLPLLSAFRPPSTTLSCLLFPSSAFRPSTTLSCLLSPPLPAFRPPSTTLSCLLSPSSLHSDLLQPPCPAFSPPPLCIQTFNHPVLPSLPPLPAFRPPSTTLSCLLSPPSLHSDLLQPPCPAFSPPPLCIQTSFNQSVLPSLPPPPPAFRPPSTTLSCLLSPLPPCIQTSFNQSVLPSLPPLPAFRPPSTNLSCLLSPPLPAFRPPSTNLSCLLSPPSLHSDLLQPICPAFSPPPPCIQTSFNQSVLPSLPPLPAFRPPSTNLSCLLSPPSLHSDLLQPICPAFSPPPPCIQTFNHPVLPSLPPLPAFRPPSTNLSCLLSPPSLHSDLLQPICPASTPFCPLPPSPTPLTVTYFSVSGPMCIL